MSLHQARFSLRITAALTDSALLSSVLGAGPAKVALDHAKSIVVLAPATLTGVVTVKIIAGGVTATLQSAGADVTIPAGKATSLPPFSAEDMRLVSTLAEGANRDFMVVIQEEIG